jgi:hypothetical protein
LGICFWGLGKRSPPQHGGETVGWGIMGIREYGVKWWSGFMCLGNWQQEEGGGHQIWSKLDWGKVRNCLAVGLGVFGQLELLSSIPLWCLPCWVWRWLATGNWVDHLFGGRKGELSVGFQFGSSQDRINVYIVSFQIL